MAHVTRSEHRTPKRIKSSSRDKKVFSSTADHTERINTGHGRPMRGGIRL